MRRIFTPLLLLLFYYAGAQTHKLSVIGSSTTACTNVSFPDCYIARLDAYYDGIGEPIDIYQLGVPGYTVYKGMPSSYRGPLPALQPDPNFNVTKALSFNPHVVLVNYPSNGFDSLRVDSVMRCFRTIRDSVIAAGKVCYITTTQPRHAGSEFNDFSERQKLKELRDSILLQFGTYAINFWDSLADPITYQIRPEYNSGDGVHLNAAGHQILFQRVRDKNIFGAALPVKLLAMAIQQQQQEVVSLKWAVQNESWNETYEVQRSTDGTSFKTFHTLTSGVASQTRQYRVVDKTPGPGMYYYRVKISEQGSAPNFSWVMKILTGKDVVRLEKMAATHFTKRLNLDLAACNDMPVMIRVMNTNGVIVSKSSHILRAGDNRLSVPLPNLPAGIYMADCIFKDRCVFIRKFHL